LTLCYIIQRTLVIIFIIDIAIPSSDDVILNGTVQNLASSYDSNKSTSSLRENSHKTSIRNVEDELSPPVTASTPQVDNLVRRTSNANNLIIMTGEERERSYTQPIPSTPTVTTEFVVDDCSPRTPPQNTDYNIEKSYMDLPRRPNSLKKRETFDSSSLRRPSEVGNTAITKNRLSFQEYDKANTRRRYSDAPPSAGTQEKRLVVVDSTYINISSVGDNLTTVKPVTLPTKVVKNGPSGSSSRERSSESESSGSITFFYTTDHNSLKPYDSSLDASLPQNLSEMSLRPSSNKNNENDLLTPNSPEKYMSSLKTASSLSLASSASEEFCANETDGNYLTSSSRHKTRDRKKGKTKERHSHGESKDKDRHRHHHHKDKNKKHKHRKHHKHQDAVEDDGDELLDALAKDITSFDEPMSVKITDKNPTSPLNSDVPTSNKPVTSAFHSSDDSKSIDSIESVEETSHPTSDNKNIYTRPKTFSYSSSDSSRTTPEKSLDFTLGSTSDLSASTSRTQSPQCLEGDAKLVRNV